MNVLTKQTYACLMIKNRDRQDPGHTSTETDRQTLDIILLRHIPVVYFLLDLRCGKCSVLLKIHVNKQIPLVFLFVELASENYNIAKFSCRLTMNINSHYIFTALVMMDIHIMF